MSIEFFSWIAVFAGAAASFAVGALWYSPLLFGDLWREAIGKSPEELGNPVRAMGHAAIISILTAIAMALLQQAAATDGIVAGGILGFAVGLGFVFMHEAKSAGFTGKQMRLVLIDGGSEIASLTVMGAVIAGLSG